MYLNRKLTVTVVSARLILTYTRRNVAASHWDPPVTRLGDTSSRPVLFCRNGRRTNNRQTITDSRKVEVSTEEMMRGAAEIDERLVEALSAYKDAVDDQSLLPISFV